MTWGLLHPGQKTRLIEKDHHLMQDQNSTRKRLFIVVGNTKGAYYH